MKYGLPVLFFCLVSCTGCKFIYKVRVDGIDIQKPILSPCGILQIALAGRGKRHFQFVQHYNLTEPIEINPDSLIITFNQDQLSLDWLRDDLLEKRKDGFLISDKGLIRTNFTLPEGVFDMDTIFVRMRNYMSCEGTFLPPQNFFFHFNRGEFFKIR